MTGQSYKTPTTDRLNLVTVPHVYKNKKKNNKSSVVKTTLTIKIDCYSPVVFLFFNLPWIRQYNLFASPCRRRTLALLHGHKIADIGQHRLQVRHFVCCLTTRTLRHRFCCCNTNTQFTAHSQRHDGRSSHSGPSPRCSVRARRLIFSTLLHNKYCWLVVSVVYVF